IAAREISSLELTKAYLDRIRMRNPLVRAWCAVDEDLALRAAAEADASPPRSPLHGVPFGVKDVIDTADLPTECGTPIHAGRRPAKDASCVAKMRAAGAVHLGKLVTTEYAMYSPNGTRHPHNLERTPGGSSSGTAAAVADRQVPLAFGNQTAGSLVRPAAFCGVFGLKPTHGIVETDGILPLQPYFDTLGYMARSVDDLQAFFGIVSGLDGSATWNEPRAPRIGLFRTYQWDHAEPETRFVLEEVAASLAGNGCDVSEFSLPEDYAGLVAVHRAVLYHGIAQSLAADYQSAGDRMSEILQSIIEEGRALDEETFNQQFAIADRMRNAINDDFGDFDALICPSAPGEAPFGLGTGSPVFQVTWTLLGVPCINLPLGTGPNGMPIGVQLIGRRHDDVRLLALANYLFERAETVDMTVPAAAAG
ncbi:MAG: Amidase, partial [Alphaproteobacteria bacterium]|nr:Amidase [Alphaproteobacteria bacterium]